MSVSPYLEAWRARWRRERREGGIRAAQALELARVVAHMLQAEYGASRVVLFGSVARGEVHAGSDLDLAVAGLAPDSLFRAGSRADALAWGFDVDLVPLESASAALLEDVRRDGVDLLGMSGAVSHHGPS